MTTSVATLSEFPLRGHALTARWGLSAAYLQDKIYAFGGYLWFHGIEGFFNDLYELDLSTSQIRRITPDGSSPTPTSRFGHTLVADERRNQLILFGGRNGTESFSDLWVFDVASNQWGQVTSSQEETRALGGPNNSTDESTIARKITDGKKNVKRPEKQGSSTSSSSSYSKLGADALSGPQARSWHTATRHGDSVYIYGGWNHTNRVFNDLWCLDLTTYRWTCIDPADPMAKPPHGRSCHQAVSWNDGLYIFGGLRDGDAVVGDMWRFSFESGTWAPVECNGQRPLPRTSAAGDLVGDSWIIHGGLTDFPRSGMAAISEILEFHFPTSTWIQRSTVYHDTLSGGARRYGHVAVSQPGTSSLVLLSGAEKYGTATQSTACRVHLVPSQAEVVEMQQDLTTTSRLTQLNRERIGELVEIVQAYETQIRQLKTENIALTERCQALSTQMASLHQQQSALQASFQAVQHGLADVEQFIPMMRSVGAAIANFGNAPSGWGSTMGPGAAAAAAAASSSGSLTRNAASSPIPVTQSSISDLRQ